MKKKIFFQFCLVAFIVLPVIGQNVDSLNQTAVQDSTYRSFRLFEEENILEITLRFDLSTYFRTKPKESYLNANITIHLSEQDSVSQDIRLRSRGIFRNSYCVLPPIELNFKNANFGYSDLNRISKLKLVPQCRSGDLNGNYLLREYLCYKLFNVMTDTSFRVRLLTINYIDTEKKRKSLTQYGFLIEPLEMLLARTNAVEVTSDALNQKSIIPRIMDRVAIFNYMIGNYDWSIPGRHNVKVIKSLNFDPSGLGIAIPYDFDWTGLVDADYAIPAENVGTLNVRERLFLGVCRTREVYEKAVVEFNQKKDEFYKVINEFPYLSKKDKKDIILYMDEFYSRLNIKKDLVDYMLSTCKNF